jgi:hypothetical protein
MRLDWSQFARVFCEAQSCGIALGQATPRRDDESDERKQEVAMQAVHNGQCGLCTHFGEHHAKSQVLVTILSSKKADESLLDECGHPKHAALHLKVTPISGCDGFAAAAQA